MLEQLLSLTGRRSLDGSDALTQYRSLMDNAAQTAESLGLVLGSPLTAVQIAALDSDIVWLVEQEIDGVTVLVPVVYLSRATAERLRVDGALIAGDTVHIDSAATARNDGTMTAGQGMWLSAGTLINDGALSGGQQLAISTAADTLNRGTLSADAVTIDAGRDVINAVQQGVAGTRGGVIEAGEGGLRIDAGRDVIHQGSIASAGHAAVTAGRDLQLDAAQISADGHLVLDAGRDLSVTAQTSTRTDTLGHTTYTRETLDASQLQAGGHLVLQSGRDTTLEAAQLEAGEAVAIAAGRDLALTTVTTTDTSLTDIDWGRYKRHTETADETVHGTSVQAGGDIALSAGRDATLTAAQVTSDEGGIAIAAGRDLTLAAAEETHEFEEDTYRKKSGFLSSKTTTTHTEVTETYAVGTTLSGETVDLAAGRDFAATAAEVVGTGDVTITAARDLTIDAGQNTRSENHGRQRRKSGLFGNGGLSVTLGSQRSANTVEVTETSHSGSLIGSLEGDTRLVAGENVTVRGSTIASPEGDIAIHGRSVNIEEVHDTSGYRQASRSKQQGLTLSASAPVVEAAMAAYDSTRTVGESNDSRVNALAAASAGYDTYQAAGTAATAMSSGQAVNVSLTLGSQQSSSEATGSSYEVVGSSINAGGRVDIAATGAGEESNVRISGSDVYGGSGASLHADGAIDILAAQNTYSQDSENRSSGWNVGVAATGGSGGWAAGITAGVNKGRGGSDGETVTHTNALVGSGGTTTLTSGGATTIRGGQVTGERVEVDVGALAVESLQDTQAYKSRQEDGSLQVTVGWGVSVSGSYGQSKIDADYASANEQSGILAGDGGYAVNVQGETDLAGGLITSTGLAETAGRNSFSTGTLTISELENRAEYKGAAFGLSGGIGTNGKGEQGQHQVAQGSGDGRAGGVSGDKSFGFGRDGDSQRSTTSSGINTRNITINDSIAQATTGSTVDEVKAAVLTSTTTDQLAGASGALENRFDAAGVQNELDIQVQVTQAFDQNRQEAKAELYARAQAKSDEARAIRMANGGHDTAESTRLDEEAAGIKETAMWLDVVAMGVYAGPDTGNLLAGETLTQVDLVRRAATADNKIVLQSCGAYGQNCVSREVDLGDVAVENGQIYVFNNGIFNSEEYALATGAKQNTNEASAQGVYYILNPYTGNAVAEVLYAGYDKLNDLLGGVLSVTTASRVNQEIINIAAEQGGEVSSVNHSRGSMTWTNAMHDLARQGQSGLPIGRVLYNGAAANAQEAANLLLDISDAGEMFQSTHFTDRIGGWIGRNPATGGKDDGSLLDSHSAYTGYLPPLGTIIEVGDTGEYVNLREVTDRHWGEGNHSEPKEVAPTRSKKEQEDEGDG